MATSIERKQFPGGFGADSSNTTEAVDLEGLKIFLLHQRESFHFLFIFSNFLCLQLNRFDAA